MGQTTGLGDVYNVPVRTGDESVAAGATLLDFWRWVGADLVTNTMRGSFAEFLVALAVGAADGVRQEWAPYDVEAEGGVKIEVKASAYLQYWSQEALSTPKFDIAPKKAWDPATGRYSGEAKRWSDVYVFCLHHHQDKATVEPLDLSQWTFFILSTARLDAERRGQKSIGLSALQELGAERVSFEGIATAVCEAARPSRGQRVS
ncbi:MAG: hypothetical protein OXH41_08280 [Chloroflexi bacterium]|nr:hypothetical protein [Chloroflexota bacterium]